MKILRGTLTFVMGMIVGIILFVIGIGGAVYALATATTVGQLQDTAGVEILDPDSQIADKTVWEAVTDLLEDIQNIDSLTLNQLIEKYGLPVPTELSGVDITALFDFPLLQIPDHLDVVINSVTLEEIGSLIGVDFTTYDIPVIQENLQNNIQTAMNNILSFIEDADNMTLRGFEDKFGLSFGDTELLSSFKDVPLSSLGSVITAIEIGVLLSVDRDLFVARGENPVFVKTDLYEQVDPSEYAAVKAGAKTYLSGADENGKAVYKELRFVKETQLDEQGHSVDVYKVDNASNAADFAATDTTPAYYRLTEYTAYDASAAYPADTVFYVPALINNFESADGSYSPEAGGYVALNTLFTTNQLNVSLNASVSGASVLLSEVWYENASSAVKGAPFGLDPEELANENSRLREGYDGYIKVYSGTSDALIQTLSSVTVDGLNNVTDTLMDMKLNELLPSSEQTSQLFEQLGGKTLRELTEQGFDQFTIADIMTVREGAYVQDGAGLYVFVPQSGVYTLYDSAVHAGETRYSLSYGEAAEGAYVLYDGVYYRYSSNDSRFDGLTRYQKVYTADVNGAFVYIENGGYYTLFNPTLHAGYTRYKLIEGYSPATAAEIEAGTGLFYYDGSLMQSCSGTQSGALYSAVTPSAKIVRRLAYVPLTDLSSAIDSLVLGDAVDIDLDVYALVSSSYGDLSQFDVQTDYYYFDDGIYKLAAVFDADFRAAHPDESIYKIQTEGADNAIMKKLALLEINGFASRVDEVIDELYLSDVMDISVSAYVFDVDGAYVFVPDGGYYTLYDAASPAHAALKRYSQIVGFREASADEIAADSGLYFYDYTLEAMSEYSASMGDRGRLFVSGEAGNKILQRFAKVKINDFNNAMNNLILGDVFALDGDVYALADAAYIASHHGETFYVYDNGLYKTAADTSDSSQAYYYKSKIGTSNAVLKKMALLTLNDMPSRMTEVINDTYLSELIDITSHASVRSFGGSDAEADAMWLISPEYAYSAQNSDGSTDRYAFVYDDDGGYYRTSEVYLEATDKQLVTSGTGTYSYVSLSSYTQLSYAALAASNVNAQYVFYKADSSTEYVYNPALTNYLIISKNDFSKLYYRDPTGSDFTYDKFYNVSASSPSSLYVEVLGAYVDYDPSVPAMSDMQKYFGYRLGFYPASADNTANGDAVFYFDYQSGSYVASYDPSTCFDMSFVTLPADSDGNFYYSKIDSGYTDGAAKYAKKYCEIVYYENAAGDYVYYGNDYTLYSAANPAHASLVRYDKREGYLAEYAEASDSGARSELSSDKIVVTREKSAGVLAAFKNNNASVGTMNSVLSALTVGELLDVQPDSIFDDDSLKGATLDNFGSAVQAKFTTMSIGEIIELSNISGVSPAVKTILEDVSLSAFFTSLTYDTASGMLYLDMEKLYA